MIKYIKGDLFTSKNHLAHCISADAKMGAGIAKQFAEKFPNIRNSINNPITGNCILYKKIFNLITKEKYWQKPTLQTIESAIKNMFYIARNMGITKISMPLIGCGLDKLKWNDVEPLIKKYQSNIEIEIYIKNKK